MLEVASTEARNSRDGDYGGEVHYVARCAKCYIGYIMGYYYIFSKGGGEGRG